MTFDGRSSLPSDLDTALGQRQALGKFSPEILSDIELLYVGFESIFCLLSLYYHSLDNASEHCYCPLLLLRESLHI